MIVENEDLKRDEKQPPQSTQLRLQAKAYEKVVRERANKSFWCALVISVFGLAFFVIPIYFLYQQSKKNVITTAEVIAPERIKAEISNAGIRNALFTNAVIICVICGVVLEIVALTIFYFYGRTLNQLDMNQRFLFANSICEDLEGNLKQQAQLKLIEYLIDNEFEDQEQLNKPIENVQNKPPEKKLIEP